MSGDEKHIFLQVIEEASVFQVCGKPWMETGVKFGSASVLSHSIANIFFLNMRNYQCETIEQSPG